MLQLPKTKRLVAFVLALLLVFVLACAVTHSAINQRMAAGRIQRMAAVRFAPWLRSMAGCSSFFRQSYRFLVSYTTLACNPAQHEPNYCWFTPRAFITGRSGHLTTFCQTSWPLAL